jgi:homoserine O-acetyltransferase
VLGGCQGTTGPSSPHPEFGSRYCRDFPVITVGDIVSVHSALVGHLGIEKLLAVIGGSLGGMQVLDWAARFPHQTDAAVVLAAAARLSGQGIAFNVVGREAINTDPHYKNGRYYGCEETPRYGLALARMLAHITYLSEASIEMKWGRRLHDGRQFGHDLLKETEFQIESYLHYQGKRFVERFDANSYIYLTKAMDYFDLEEAYGSLTKALGRTDARFLVVSYSTDWLFPTSQSKELVAALVETGRHVSFIELESQYGHDSFLIGVDQLAAVVAPFLGQTHLAARHRGAGR